MQEQPNMEEFSTAIVQVLEKAGYAIVPMEPTRKMINAAAGALSPKKRPTPDWVSVREKHKIRYKAMVNAFLGREEYDQTEVDEDEGEDMIFTGNKEIQVMSWQPIETAPKDGTYIILFNRGYLANMIIGQWHKEIKLWIDQERHTVPNPPYWMPCPDLLKEDQL